MLIRKKEEERKAYISDLSSDLDDVFHKDTIVLANVQIEDVIVDQPQCHLSRHLSRGHGDVQQLPLGGLVKTSSGVQRCSKIRIVL